MKQILSLSFAMFVLCIAGYAFGSSTDSIKVTLPMAAHIGDTKLPAGEYTIHVMDTSAGVPVLEVSSRGGVHILVPASRQEENGSEKTDLVLTHDGADFRISSMHVSGRSYSYDLLVSATHTK